MGFAQTMALSQPVASIQAQIYHPLVHPTGVVPMIQRQTQFPEDVNPSGMAQD